MSATLPVSPHLILSTTLRDYFGDKKMMVDCILEGHLHTEASFFLASSLPDFVSR